MKILHLNLTAEEFDRIRLGRDPFAYRHIGPIWQRILKRKQFDCVSFQCTGCAPLLRKWCGYEIHPMKSLDGPISVFAIRVEVPL